MFIFYELEVPVADLIFVAVILAFFGLAVLLVQACDRIIGPDPAMERADGLAADGAPAVTDLDAEEVTAW